MAKSRGERSRRSKAEPGRSRTFSALILLLCVLLSPAAGARSEAIELVRQGPVLSLSWADAEDRLTGAIAPQAPRVNEPVTATLKLGSFTDPQPEGPLNVTFRHPASGWSQGFVLEKEGPGHRLQLTPEKSGEHLLLIGFRTTRYKVAQARFEVAPEPIPPWVRKVALAAAAVAAALLIIRAVKLGLKAVNG